VTSFISALIKSRQAVEEELEKVRTSKVSSNKRPMFRRFDFDIHNAIFNSRAGETEVQLFFGCKCNGTVRASYSKEEAEATYWSSSKLRGYNDSQPHKA